MRGPEPKDPDLAIPPKGSNEFIKRRRSFMSLISKPLITSGVKSAKRVSFKAGKGSNSLKEMEEDVIDGSCGESISDLQDEVEKELVRKIVNETFKVNNLSNVVKDASVGNVIDGGETLTDGESRSNVEFLFNKVKKLPSLNENRNVNDMDIIMEKLDEVRHVNEDFVMQEGDSVKKRVSFVNVVQGIRGNRNNKLRRIAVSIDESMKKRVYIDLLIEEGSKSRGMTLVGYFMGLRISYKEIIGHLRRIKWIMACGWEAIIHSEVGSWCVYAEARTFKGSQVIWVILKSYGRASFTRVLIEIEAESGLVDEIKVYYTSIWKSMKIRVEYPWKPPMCAHCKVFGHGYDMCNAPLRKEDVMS
nr:hypothetical protein [Tanacetum cinerariifolium]